MSEKPKRKLVDVVDVLKKAIGSGYLANALTMLENLAKEADAYVKFKPEDILALYYDPLPYNSGIRVEVVMRNGVVVAYDIFRYEDYVDRVQLRVGRL